MSEKYSLDYKPVDISPPNDSGDYILLGKGLSYIEKGEEGNHLIVKGDFTLESYKNAHKVRVSKIDMKYIDIFPYDKEFLFISNLTTVYNGKEEIDIVINQIIHLTLSIISVDKGLESKIEILKNKLFKSEEEKNKLIKLEIKLKDISANYIDEILTIANQENGEAGTIELF